MYFYWLRSIPYKCHDSTHTFDGNHGNNVNIIVHMLSEQTGMMPLVPSLISKQVHIVAGAYELCTEYCTACIPFQTLHLLQTSPYVVEAAIVTVTHHNMYIGPIKSL